MAKRKLPPGPEAGFQRRQRPESKGAERRHTPHSRASSRAWQRTARGALEPMRINVDREDVGRPSAAIC